MIPHLLCEEEHHEGEDHDHGEHEDLNKSEIWTYALLTCVMMGVLGFLCSVAVVVFKKEMTSQAFRPYLNVLVAFAAAALLGDAFVHLIPEAFGV